MNFFRDVVSHLLKNAFEGHTQFSVADNTAVGDNPIRSISLDAVPVNENVMISLAWEGGEKVFEKTLSEKEAAHQFDLISSDLAEVASLTKQGQYDAAKDLMKKLGMKYAENTGEIVQTNLPKLHNTQAAHKHNTEPLGVIDCDCCGKQMCPDCGTTEDDGEIHHNKCKKASTDDDKIWRQAKITMQNMWFSTTDELLDYQQKQKGAVKPGDQDHVPLWDKNKQKTPANDELAPASMSYEDLENKKQQEHEDMQEHIDEKIKTELESALQQKAASVFGPDQVELVNVLRKNGRNWDEIKKILVKDFGFDKDATTIFVDEQRQGSDPAGVEVEPVKEEDKPLTPPEELVSPETHDKLIQDHEDKKKDDKSVEDSTEPNFTPKEIMDIPEDAEIQDQSSLSNEIARADNDEIHKVASDQDSYHICPICDEAWPCKSDCEQPKNLKCPNCKDKKASLKTAGPSDLNPLQEPIEQEPTTPQQDVVPMGKKPLDHNTPQKGDRVFVASDMNDEKAGFEGTFISTYKSQGRDQYIVETDEGDLLDVDAHRVSKVSDNNGAQTTEPSMEPVIETPKEAPISVTPKMSDFHTSSLKEAGKRKCEICGEPTHKADSELCSACDEGMKEASLIKAELKALLKIAAVSDETELDSRDLASLIQEAVDGDTILQGFAETYFNNEPWESIQAKFLKGVSTNDQWWMSGVNGFRAFNDQILEEKGQKPTTDQQPIASLKQADSHVIMPMMYGIDDDSLLQYANGSIFADKIKSGQMQDKDWESLVRETGRWMTQVGRQKVSQTFPPEAQWFLDDEQINKLKTMFNVLPKENENPNEPPPVESESSKQVSAQKKCEVCRESFTPTIKGQVYCSKDCSDDDKQMTDEVTASLKKEAGTTWTDLRMPEPPESGWRVQHKSGLTGTIVDGNDKFANVQLDQPIKEDEATCRQYDISWVQLERGDHPKGIYAIYAGDGFGSWSGGAPNWLMTDSGGKPILPKGYKIPDHDKNPNPEPAIDTESAMVNWKCPKCGSDASASSVYDEKICMKDGCGTSMEKQASAMDTKCEDCGQPLGPEAFLSKWPVCGKCTKKRHKKVTGSLEKKASTDYYAEGKMTLQQLRKIPGIKLQKSPDGLVLTDGENYLHVYAPDNRNGNFGFARFGANDVEGILDAVSAATGVQITDEYTMQERWNEEHEAPGHKCTEDCPLFGLEDQASKQSAIDNGPSDADVQQMAWEMFKAHWNALSSEQMDQVYKALGVTSSQKKADLDYYIECNDCPWGWSGSASNTPRPNFTGKCPKCGSSNVEQGKESEIDVSGAAPTDPTKTQFKDVKITPKYVPKQEATPATPELDVVLSKMDALQQNLATLASAREQIEAKMKEELTKVDQQGERVQMEAELQESVEKAAILINALDSKIVQWKDKLLTLQTEDINYVPKLTPKEMLAKIYAKFDGAEKYVQDVLNGMLSLGKTVTEKTLYRWPNKKSSTTKEASVLDDMNRINEELMAALKELSSPI